MAKRFTSTEIWSEDWFLDMPNEYKLFWFYSLSICNHAGLFRVNLRSFCGLNNLQLTAQEALGFFNKGKDRVRVVSDNIWYFEDFIVFQYGPTLNINNRVHFSIMKELKNNKIELTSIRGLKGVNDTLKDKDKDYSNYLNNKNGVEIFSPLLNEHGFVSTSEAKDRYLNRDEYQISREAMIMTKTKNIKSLIFWIDKFNSHVDIQAKKQNMEGWLSYFGNWMNKNFDPTLNQLQTNGPETAQEKRQRLIKEQQQRNAVG